MPSTTSNKSNAQLTLSTHPSTSNDNDNLGKWSSKQLDCNQETTLIALIHQQNDLDNIAGGILSTSTNRFRENHHFDHICYSIEQLYKNSQQVIVCLFLVLFLTPSLPHNCLLLIVKFYFP